MTPQLDFHQYLWFLQLLVKVVEWAAKRFPEWRRKQKEMVENRILDYLNYKKEPSRTSIIWADVFLKPIIEDVPFNVAFPPKLRGWKRLRLELRRFPYEVRHRWRLWRRMVPEEKVEEVLKKLLREAKIVYNPNTQRYSARP